MARMGLCHGMSDDAGTDGDCGYPIPGPEPEIRPDAGPSERHLYDGPTTETEGLALSTIIIITPPTKPNANRVVETEAGAEIQNEEGSAVATFEGPQAYENAIKYLKVMKG